jgi:hypothetical protein
MIWLALWGFVVRIWLCGVEAELIFETGYTSCDGLEMRETLLSLSHWTAIRFLVFSFPVHGLSRQQHATAGRRECSASLHGLLTRLRPTAYSHNNNNNNNNQEKRSGEGGLGAQFRIIVFHDDMKSNKHPRFFLFKFISWVPKSSMRSERRLFGRMANRDAEAMLTLLQVTHLFGRNAVRRLAASRNVIGCL